MSKYIDIKESGTSASGKTKVFSVVSNHPNHSEDEVGYIAWSGAWRKYVYHSPANSFYDWECLRKIADFCETATKEHQSGRR